MRKLAPALAAAVLSLAACSGDDDAPGGFRGSCADFFGVCVDFYGPFTSAELSETRTTCNALGGPWSDSAACPTAGRSGTCTFADGAKLESVRYYDPATAAQDAADCAQDGGAWTAN